MPFLEHFYSVLGKFVRLDNADEIIQKLKSEQPKSEQPKSLQTFLDNESFYNFQESYSNDSYDFYFEKENSLIKNKIHVSSDIITLAFTGKIMKEETGGFFEFFEALIRQNFSSFDFAKAVRVYITG